MISIKHLACAVPCKGTTLSAGTKVHIAGRLI